MFNDNHYDQSNKRYKYFYTFYKNVSSQFFVIDFLFLQKRRT